LLNSSKGENTILIIITPKRPIARNERRRIEIDNLEQYGFKTEKCTEQEEGCDCGVKEVEVCLNCTKLLVQPPFESLQIENARMAGPTV